MASARIYSEKLRGSRVLILGGSSGIGYGLADALLELNAQVIISSSSQRRISSATRRLREAHPDVPNASIQEIAEDERLDHVVFTAGDPLPIKRLEDFSLAEIQSAGTVRFFAPLIIAQHLKKHLVVSGASSFTLSTGGVPEHLMPNWSVAQAYLGGINSMARGLAVEVAPIRVNAIGLGPVETELWDSVKQAGMYDSIRAGFDAKMTTGAIGKVVDVVEAYLYVLKDRNVSGSTINSHGGTLLL